MKLSYHFKTVNMSLQDFEFCFSEIEYNASNCDCSACERIVRIIDDYRHRCEEYPFNSLWIHSNIDECTDDLSGIECCGEEEESEEESA